MEEMKLSSSGFIGALAANILGFGSAVAEEIFRTFGQQHYQEGMACPRSTTQSLHNIMAKSLIGPIWRK
jgi:hypothetical protein